MNVSYSFLKILKLLILTTILSLPIVIYAKAINLYDQPKSEAKVIATIDPSAGIIPIYTPKEGSWVKIADPKNGNVGWVKSNDLNSAGLSQSIFTFTQSTDNKTPTTYRIIQYGQSTKLTPEQTQALVKQMQTEQQELQKSIQSMMRDMDQLFYNHWHFMHHESFPFFVPVVIMPVEKTSQPVHVDKQQKSSIIPTATSTHNIVDNKIKK